MTALPWCDVNIYDQFEDGSSAIVDIELAHAEVWVSDPQDVTVYQDLVRRLWGDAVVGADVSAFLADLAKVWNR